MSELVELRREQAIREYECMKHLNLFTDAEIQSIKNKRHYHDFKIERRTKRLSDFINYIAYECNVFHLLLQRRQKLHISAEWTSLEQSIHRRVRVLYKRAMARFAAEYRVWTHFLQYCQMRRFFAEGSRVLDQMLGYHGDKPKAWLCAIEWEYRQANNPARAKHYTLRGLQRHPECRELAIGFIGIQLEEGKKVVEKARESKQGLVVKGKGNDPPLDQPQELELEKALKTAQVVYRNFEQKDMRFYEQLLTELKEHCPLSNTLARQAVAEMRETLTDQEAMWHLLAKLELEGDAFVKKEAEQTKPHERLAKCLAVYKEAVERLPTKKMHSLCIETMLQLNSVDESEHDEKAKRKALAGAFKRALVDDLLEEDKLLQYLKLLLHNSNPNEELVMKVINKGLEQYPASVDVWSAYLRYQILQEVGADELEDTFRKALNTLPERVSRLVLWKQMFQYYSERPALQGTLEQLFRRAIDQEPEISNHYQPLYLDYLMASAGDNLARVRSEYQRLVRNYTTPLELHTKMASLEASQTPPEVSEWRKCYEYMTLFYGKQDATVWLQYVQFERDHGQPKHMQSLYERAKGALDEDSFATFMAEYELIRNPYIVRY
ncbi:U3 small nucleolar RNA-associated protein 6 homolog [Anopheles merus]|uniref:U3 small nucleolar RNA-associated protein 6 homolog n=1 Tax=Anopheles merus TaxID=30066 RepID=A0A182VGV8_ANOME|nr:U3 small nucleolar RNA-associated protein 6 homolog [Anopheles merus]